MIVTISWIENNYNKYNELYWGGKLPKIKFKISNSRKTWGYAAYRWFRTGIVIPVEIVMSNYYDSPERVKLNTLLHEMIHIADYTLNPRHFVCNGHKVHYDAHGYWFKSEAKRLAQYGWEIEKYVSVEETSISTVSAANQAKENATITGAVLAICYCGNNQVWCFKTNDYNISNIYKTIKCTSWMRYGGLKEVKFYKFNNPDLALKRSCVTRLSGFRCSNIQFGIYMKEWSMKEIKSYIIDKDIFKKAV